MNVNVKKAAVIPLAAFGPGYLFIWGKVFH